MAALIFWTSVVIFGGTLTVMLTITCNGWPTPFVTWHRYWPWWLLSTEGMDKTPMGLTSSSRLVLKISPNFPGVPMYQRRTKKLLSYKLFDLFLKLGITWITEFKISVSKPVLIRYSGRRHWVSANLKKKVYNLKYVNKFWKRINKFWILWTNFASCKQIVTNNIKSLRKYKSMGKFLKILISYCFDFISSTPKNVSNFPTGWRKVAESSSFPSSKIWSIMIAICLDVCSKGLAYPFPSSMLSLAKGIRLHGKAIQLSVQVSLRHWRAFLAKMEVLKRVGGSFVNQI